MATTTESKFPTPSPWLSFVIAIVAGYGSAKYEAGQNEQRMKSLETFKETTEKRWEKERTDREAKYEAAEQARNSQKDAAVEQMQKTTNELRETLQGLKNGNK